jgi:hypothetical protein
MRHTLKESILQGPVHFYVVPVWSYLCRLLSGEALHRAIPCRLGSGSVWRTRFSTSQSTTPCLPTIVNEFYAAECGLVAREPFNRLMRSTIDSRAVAALSLPREIAYKLHKESRFVSARLNQLREDGRVVQGEKRACRHSGLNAYVWRISETLF